MSKLLRLYRNTELLALKEAEVLRNPRVDALSVVTFIKLLYPVEYALFSADNGAQDLKLRTALHLINV